MTEVYVTTDRQGNVAIFYQEDEIKKYSWPYFKFFEEDIPDGEGKLKTDGISKIWREVSNEKEPTNPVVNALKNALNEV